MLTGKTIVLGVTGSIAAYKAADMVSRLKKLHATVHVVMTESASQLVSPLTLQTLSCQPVASSLWSEKQNWVPGHIELADKADLFLIAPTTANTIAKLTYGIADNLLTCIYLATRAPVLIAPAMNVKMYEHPATQENIGKLKVRGVRFVEPATGMLACGYEGKGKLADVDTIIMETQKLLK